MSSHRLPKLRQHKPSQLGVVTLNGHDFYLGHWPRSQKEPPDEVRAEYDRRIAEWLAQGRTLPQDAAPTCTAQEQPSISVNELILAYWSHVETYYRHPDGTPTSEVDNIRLALKPLRRLYGHTPAAGFDSLALEALRQEMIRQGRCRKRVNKDVARAKRLFKWGAARKLVPLDVLHMLQTVEGLREGRSEARETADVKPVTEAVVPATLPHLRRQVAATVRLQWLIGMRPGEVIIMRTLDLEMTGSVWLYRPGSDQGPHGRHKTAHPGQDRVILIGPRAQEILRPWLRLNLKEYLFQPRESRAQFDAERSQKRQSKVPPSQAKRQKKAKPKKVLGKCYTVISYDHAIAKACEKAFPPPPDLLPRKGETLKSWRARLSEEKAELHMWQRQHRWHPNQLRHAKATELRRVFVIDAARVVLRPSPARLVQLPGLRFLGRSCERTCPKFA